jgi:uncharacterized phosphosugar-binding protein
VTLYEEFFEAVGSRLALLRREAAGPVEAAADVIVRAHVEGRRTFVFGSGHSALLAQEVCLRAGSLATYHPIYVPGLLPTDPPYLRGTALERVSGIAAVALDSAGVGPGDCLVVVSNSGRNAVPVEMAIEARARGSTVIAVTALETARAQPSRHSGGRHLHDVADVVIDTCAPHGDAAVAVPGVPARVGPLSTILGAVVMHAVTAAVVERMLAAGAAPPLLASGNIEGGERHSLDVLRRHRDQVTPLAGLPADRPRTD